MKQHKVVLYNTEGTGIGVEEKVLRDMGCYDKFNLVRIDGDRDDDFFKEAADADGVIIVYIDMNRENFEKLPNCKVLTIHAIGVNNIDQKAATDLGICVGNVPTYCLEEVAVHTIAMVLDGARKITQMDRRVRRGEWPDVTGCGKIFNTMGKTYGLVAFGNIPRRIAEIAKEFGMRVIAYDPFVAKEEFEQNVVRRVDTLEELFAESDYISVHTPRLPSTYHMIGKKQFDALKPGAVFVVTGRGGVVDEDALKAAITSGKVSFAAFDVLENEISLGEVESGSPLMGMEEVVMTPHTAYYSEESLVQCRIDAMKQIVEVLEGKKLPSYLVNKDVAGKARFQK
ncbi:MAG: C-terminal binding protein [Clostridiales Family XIII bacterium]|jgi:D-3-phosphoglycerate dehydrogenase|nr:C-terminal binding protein [Clostridiales Family XIII bacterium]